MPGASLKEIDRPVFVVGCARSGTSILGEILQASDRFVYVFEAHGVWERRFGHKPDHRLVAEDATAPVSRQIMDDFGHLITRRYATGEFGRVRDPIRSRRLAEKCPRNVLRIPFLHAIFPRAQVVHIIRDGRDVVCSLHGANRGARWAHLRVPGWRDLLAHDPEGLLRSAHQWRRAVEIGTRDGRTLPEGRYHEIRYEMLVEDPEEHVGILFAFLGEEVSPEVLAMARKVQDRIEGSYQARGQDRHLVLQGRQGRIGRWRTELGPEELERVLRVISPTLKEVGIA